MIIQYLDGDAFWLLPVTMVLIIFFILLFFVSRYKKFRTNEYVIHLRNGKVKAAGLGGRLFKLPLIDDIIILPTTLQMADIPLEVSAVGSATLLWRIVRPDIAYATLSWDFKAPNFAEAVIKELSGQFLRKELKNLDFTTWLSTEMPSEVKSSIIKDLEQLLRDHGLVVESIEFLYKLQ